MLLTVAPIKHSLVDVRKRGVLVKKPGHKNVGQAENPTPGEMEKTNWHVGNDQVKNKAHRINF